MSTPALQRVALPPPTPPPLPVPPSVRGVRLAAADDRGGSRRRSSPAGRRDRHAAGRKAGRRRRLDQSLEEHGAPRRAELQLVVVVVVVARSSPLPRLHPKRSHVSVLADAEVEAPASAASSAVVVAAASWPGGCPTTSRRLRVLPAVVDVVQSRHGVVPECTLGQLVRPPLKRTSSQRLHVKLDKAPGEGLSPPRHVLPVPPSGESI